MEYYLEHLDDERYTQPIELLSQASTGQHTRHVIEFFQCLLEQSACGRVDYDARMRNPLIEQFTASALEAIGEIKRKLPLIDPLMPLELAVDYERVSKDSPCVQSTFERELVYNVEHAIHHLAMIKIALKLSAPELSLRSGFGVAPSTMRHRAEADKP